MWSGISEACACGASEAVRSAHSEVLRQSRKVKLSVPLIVPKAHFTREACFTRVSEINVPRRRNT